MSVRNREKGRRHGSRLPLSWLAVQLLVACSEPAYGSGPPDASPARDALPAQDAAPTLCQQAPCDAGPAAPEAGEPAALPNQASDAAGAVDPQRDAGLPLPPSAHVQPDSGALSLEERELPGKYALVARFFGRDTAGLGAFSEEVVSLATIERTKTSGKFAMQAETCEHGSQIDAVVVAPITSRVLKPEKLPVRTFELTASNGSFRTFGPPTLSGYEEVSAAKPCPAGTKQRHPERKWLPAGECSCPLSALPPTQVDDCRVIDVDGDDHPGLTVQFTGGTENLAYSRLRDSSQMVDGTIAENGRHRAFYAPMLETFHLKCVTSSCSRASARVCAPQFNPVRFVRLETRADGRDWTCADVLKDIAATGGFELGPAIPPEC